MPLSPTFLYETMLRAPDAPPEPALVIGPQVGQDGSLAFLALTANVGPLPQTVPPGALVETPYGFLWTIGGAPVVFQLATTNRFDAYWREHLPEPFPPFATNEELWRWFNERYGWGQPAPSDTPTSPATPGAERVAHGAAPPPPPAEPPLDAPAETRRDLAPASSPTSAAGEWADLARRHRAAEDAALRAALDAFAEATRDDDGLRAFGVQVAALGYAGTADTLVTWLLTGPTGERLVVVATMLRAVWRADNALLFASAEMVHALARVAQQTTAAAARAAVIAALEAARDIPAHPAIQQQAAAALETLHPPLAAEPPASPGTEAIAIRQLPPSEESNAGGEDMPLSIPADPAPLDAATALVIVVEDGEARGRRVPLTGRIIVGRHAACDLALPDMEVSRHHAVIERDDAGRTTIHDTESANGTFVNGARISTHPLQPGDRLTLGQTNLRVASGGEA